MSTFKEMLQASFKSNDTEEWLDVHFTRPIGLVYLLSKRSDQRQKVPQKLQKLQKSDSHGDWRKGSGVSRKRSKPPL